MWVPWESAKWGDTDELSEEEFNKDVLAGLERYCVENCRHVNVYKYTSTFWWTFPDDRDPDDTDYPEDEWVFQDGEKRLVRLIFGNGNSYEVKRK